MVRDDQWPREDLVELQLAFFAFRLTQLMRNSGHISACGLYYGLMAASLFNGFRVEYIVAVNNCRVSSSSVAAKSGNELFWAMGRTDSSPTWLLPITAILLLYSKSEAQG